jgi:dTDP-4-amino-4,6-dideoxygalactose transaminase
MIFWGHPLPFDQRYRHAPPGGVSHRRGPRRRRNFLPAQRLSAIFQGQAAVLRLKLPCLCSWTVRRQEIAREYRGRLAAARVEIPLDDPGDECVYHQSVIYVNNRSSVTSQLAACGFDRAVHYPNPLHLQSAYSSRGYPPGTFPRAERACERVLSIPMFMTITAE